MLSNLILMDGESDIATFFCAACGRQFEADIHGVTCMNKDPICLHCIEAANPKRVELGLPEIPVIRSAYH